VDAADAVINPIRRINDPQLAPLALMTANQGDTQRLNRQLGLANAHRRNVLMSRIVWADDVVSVTGPLLGAPYAAMLLETLVAWGARDIVFWGWCGSISPRIKIGDIIVPTGALIDEGTSAHYGADRCSPVRPSTALNAHILAAFERRGLPVRQGLVWSTDGFFRETRERVEHYRQMNAVAVEMETSALFSVARFRHVRLTAVVVVSDELGTFQWRPGFDSVRFKHSRSAVCEVITSLCQTLQGTKAPKRSRP
jgi:uridine phosphorylase